MKNKFDAFLLKIQELLNISDKSAMLIVSIVIILLVNVAGSTLYFRIDLTRNNAYSLSDKSKQVVSNLSERLKIRVLFSDNLPARYNSVKQYLRDLMEEYDNASNRYFKYEIITGDELDEQARKFGLQQIQTQEIVKDEGKVKRGYMGLVIQHAQLIEKIDRISDPDGLEFLITSRIEKMTSKVSKLLKLKDEKKHISVKVVVDGNLKELGIQKIDSIPDEVKKAVDKSNATNYDILKVSYIDPSKDPKLAKEFARYGLQALNWKNTRGASGKMIKAGTGYLGIVLESDGKYQVIDSLKVQQRLDLFRGQVVNSVGGFQGLTDALNEGINQLLSPSKKIGYITGHGEVKLQDRRSRDGGGILYSVLSEVYDVKQIDLSKQDIPGDISTIIINGPRTEFSDYELYKIDQHLMKGKSALFFVDVYDQSNQMRRQMMFRQQPQVVQIKTGLDKLLNHYGVTVNKDIVLDENSHKQATRQGMTDYYIAPIIKRSGLNEDNVITKYINGAIFLKTSSVTANTKKKEVSSTSLVSTSDESWLMKGRINFNPMMWKMQKSRTKNLSSYDLAVLVEGTMDSYFKGAEIPVNPNDKNKGKIRSSRLKTSDTISQTVKDAKTKIIVVGTSEITKSGFLMNAGKILTKGMGNSMQNVNLIHHMVDYLSGNTSIPEMKSKGLEFNPLVKTEDTTRLVLKILNIAGLPVMIIIIGLLIMRGRAARKKRIRDLFAGGSVNE